MVYYSFCLNQSFVQKLPGLFFEMLLTVGMPAGFPV